MPSSGTGQSCSVQRERDKVTQPAAPPVTADQIQHLKRQAEEARQQQARAEAARDSAQAAVQTAQEQLRAEFGVEDPEAAHALLASMELAVQSEAAAVAEALARAQ